VTAKLVGLVVVPPAVTTAIFPLVAVAGTVAVIWLDESTVKLDAATQLNFAALTSVKPEPEIVTLEPTGPLGGEKEVSLGSTLNVPTL
jgi:hypothetical protein